MVCFEQPPRRFYGFGEDQGRGVGGSSPTQRLDAEERERLGLQLQCPSRAIELVAFGLIGDDAGDSEQRAVVVGGESVRGVIRAAVDAYVPVRFAFLERSGNPVNPSTIRSMTIKRSDGAVFTLSRKQLRSRRALRMQASRVVALSGGLVSKPLGYRIQSVLVGGNNVVNRSQQGFVPLHNRQVNVKLLFYSLKVKATDRLFGVGVGSGFTLVLPRHDAR